MNIIYELDREGINLQETRLNLDNQGYGYVFDDWLRYILNKAINQIQMEIAFRNLREKGLL